MNKKDFIFKVERKEYYYEDKIEFIIAKYKEVKAKGELLSANDGQFTGGYYDELYSYINKKYSFGFDPYGKLDSLVIYPL